MKYFKIKFLALLGSIVLLSGCSVDNDNEQFCYYRALMATTAVTGPDTTTINTPITLNVSFLVGNSCGVFFDFVETSNGYPKQIVAALDFNGCECQEVTGTDTKPYIFTATTAGTYQLEFLRQDEQTPIIKTIVVTE